MVKNKHGFASYFFLRPQLIGKYKGIKNENMGISFVKTETLDRNGWGQNMANNNNLPTIEKMLNDNFKKTPMPVKKLQYKMNFGATEVVVKLGLN